jgi:voltage-dependent potassium channel beta subunit
MEMPYRRLGRAGVKVSVLSFGSWVTFSNQLALDSALECMQTAHDAGVNFFDNAEAYAAGESERIMGQALRELGWPRESYLISTKFFWGITPGVNTKNTLNRKYLSQAIDRSLERFGLDFVDLVFCHRADPETPIEETVWTMSEMVSSGKALYWGTSEWSAEEIREAYELAERHHLHKPVMEQPQYHLLHRDRMEREYAPIFEKYGMGTTIWSPLASGLLTGKYSNGIPEDSRANLPGYEWLKAQLTDPEALARVARLQKIADRLDCKLSQLAIAWCAANPQVSTVITGASRVSQVRENMESLEVLEMMTPELREEIEAAVA